MSDSTPWGRITRNVEREPDHRLSAGLGIPSVMPLAVGSVVGTGVFVIVNVAVLVLRLTRPDLPRALKVPLGPVIPLVAIAVNLYLMSQIRVSTWLAFAVWLAIGIVIYLTYGQRNSRASMQMVEQDLPAGRRARQPDDVTTREWTCPRSGIAEPRASAGRPRTLT